MNTHHPAPPQRPRYNIGYRTCPRCDFQFTPEQHDQTVCNLCHTDRVFRVRRVNVTKRYDPRECRGCNVTFTPTKATAYCSEECREHTKARRKSTIRAVTRPAPIEITCIICDVKVITRQPSQLLCSRTCRNAHQAAKRAEKRRAAA